MIRREVYKGGSHVRTIEIERMGGSSVEYRRFEPPATLDEQRAATQEEIDQLRAKMQSEEHERVRERAEQALSSLETIAGSSGDLTISQLSDAVRMLARVLAALIRFVLRKITVQL